MVLINVRYLILVDHENKSPKMKCFEKETLALDFF